MIDPHSSQTRQALTDLIEQQHLQSSDVPKAIALAEISPTPHQWQSFVQTSLFWSSILGLAFAVIFFVAANWQEIGRLAKFGLVEAVIVLSVLGYCKSGSSQVVRKACLLVGMLSVGAVTA